MGERKTKKHGTEDKKIDDNALHPSNVVVLFGLVSLFNDISIFVRYLMPKHSL